MIQSLSLTAGLGFLTLGLLFTSLLALLGSLLWGFIPYWPIFMLANLAVLHVGSWAIALAALAPVVTSVLFQDSPLGVYVPVNIIQVVAFLAGARALNIDRGLRRWSDRGKFVVVSMAASYVGAVCAFAIRAWIEQPVTDSFMFFTWMWTIENTIPAILPGIWLHKVISDTYQPFDPNQDRKPVSWMWRTLEYALPWMFTLLVVGAMIVVLLLQQASPGHGIWKVVDEAPALRVIAFVLSLAILYAVGSAVQHAKQSWTLVEAVRRHLPNRRLSELLTGGSALPTEQRLVTVMFTDLRGFTETSAQFEPGDLVAWLNTYFTHMGAVCERHGAAIDKFIGDGIMIVFGLQSPDAQSRQAVLCALDMLDALKAWQAESVARGFPAVGMGIGIHTGIVTAGEIGSPQRRQYTVIGPVVNTAARLESASKEVTDDALPIVMSREATKHCGLLVHPDRDKLVTAMSVKLKGVVDVDSAFAVRADAVAEVRGALLGALEAVKLR